jgi:hypothetical protein
MTDNTSNRFGKFLLIIGLMLWVIFFATDRIHNPEFAFFFWGTVCLGSGILLMWRNRPAPSQPAERFRTVRRVSRGVSGWRSRRRDKQAAKESQKQSGKKTS